MKISALLLLFSAASTAAAGVQPRFSFSPTTLKAGQQVTVTGSGFGAASTYTLAVLTNDAAQARVLGYAPVVNGAVSATFTVPADLRAGRYLFGFADQALRGAVNLTGTLTIVPTASPWFEFSPRRVAQGGTVTVSAQGFSSAATYAVVGVVNNLSQTRTLGYAPITKGAFSRAFVLPADLGSNTTYRLYTVSSAQEYATGVAGPLSIAAISGGLTIPVGDYPVGADFNTVTNRLFVGNSGESTLSVIDGTASQVVNTVATGDLPCALGVNLLNGRVYVANLNANTVSVIDGATGALITSVPTGGSPCAVRVLPALNRIFVGNYRTNNITVIDGTSNAVIATIPLGGPAYGLAANTKTNRIYAATGMTNTLTTIDGAANSVLSVIPVGAGPDAVAVNTANNRVYVANYFGDSVTVIDGTVGTVVSSVFVGREPSGITVNPVTGHVFIGNYGSDTVSVLDGISGRVIATIATGRTPDGITVNPLTGRVYSVNSNTRDITVITDSATAFQ